MLGLPAPESPSCPECGLPITLEHECDDERRRWHQLFLVNVEVQQLDRELRAFFDSPRGRFEAYYAQRERLLEAA